MSIRLDKKLIVWVAVAALALLAVIVVALGANSSPATADSEGNPVRGFSVLQPATAGDVDALPANVRGWVNATSKMPFSGGPVTALGTAKTTSGNVYVAAIGKSVCALTGLGGLSSCGEVPMASEGKAFAAAPDGCGSYSVVGIMPDGVSELAVDRRADGQVDETIRVSGNVYQATFDAVPTVLSAEKAGISVTLPLDEYAKMSDCE